MASYQLLLAQDGLNWAGYLVAALLAAAATWAAMYFRGQAAAAARKSQVETEIAQARQRRDEILKTAEIEGQKLLLELKQKFEQENNATRDELKETERRLSRREDNIDKKMDVLNTKERKLEEREQAVERRDEALAAKETEIDRLLTEQRAELLRVSKLTADEARTLCLERTEREVEREAGQLVEKLLLTAQETAREKARVITIDAIQRYAAEHTGEATVDTVAVPSDEMKGRIIGREGRNIRAFEKETGVAVIVDDTPGIVSISCFNPIRKEIARISLERLIKDGRIHPTRIEELVVESTREVEARCADYGKHAALEANVHGLNKKIVDTLGRLHFRTSYGQNVLKHSIEVAFLTGVMAEELGLDGALARRCGLLHDIGKALDQEVEGTHTQLGAEFLKKFNEHPAVLNAAAGHHGDVAATHVFTPLVTAADAISASRPGSRRESLERYIKRLEELEGIATSFGGVRQAHAVEAGREIRVIVDAMQVDDRSSLKLARDIAKRIEESMTYPGEIKVTVLREIRAVEYAR